MDKCAVIGNRESVLGFKAIGMDVFAVTDPEEAARLVKKLAQARYAAVFITEPLAIDCKELFETYSRQPLPAVIPIPGTGVPSGLGMARVRDNAERAVGADILFE